MDWSDILELRRLEEYAAKLGFCLGNTRFPAVGRTGQPVALLPADNCLVIYSRDAEIYCGSTRDIDAFLSGWEKGQQYLKLLGAVTDARIQKKEQDFRNEVLVQLLSQQESGTKKPPF